MSLTLRKGFFGLCRESEEERYDTVLSAISIDDNQKNSIRRRYIHLLQNFRARAFRYSLLFHIGHLIITVGSLIVPALLSVQYTQSGATVSPVSSTEFQMQVYWSTWVLSLLVTTCNGVLVLFKVDKHYYSLHTSLERLRSEGWQYLELTGRYSGVLTQHAAPPTHANQYQYFCHYVEKIKLKQIEDEYYKYEDTTNGMGTPGTAQGTAQQPKESLFPPSLDKPLSSLIRDAPQSVTDALNSLIIPATASNLLAPGNTTPS
jgi:Protein of unknown function (DUF4231)